MTLLDVNSPGDTENGSHLTYEVEKAAKARRARADALRRRNMREVVRKTREQLEFDFNQGRSPDATQKNEPEVFPAVVYEKRTEEK